MQGHGDRCYYCAKVLYEYEDFWLAAIIVTKQCTSMGIDAIIVQKQCRYMGIAAIIVTKPCRHMGIYAIIMTKEYRGVVCLFKDNS
ncbi:hypothetical protein DPMN_098247 [Dreissena polymorpha]|uniref:Uncharacterized protein n=1 Tax=Dreissena polymorpha TaxID=45954 RepID=A0A9D4R6H3_DREPO|nr:hypothetical protein DPMN_098247 [Dreissena polymorpha]